MRRPTPLSAPQPTGDSAPAADSDGAAELDPLEIIVPLAPRSDSATSAPAPTTREPSHDDHTTGERIVADLTTDDDLAAEPVARDVGVRDVWSAARARRRALRAEVRRFTVRQRRRRLAWIGVAAALVLLVLGTLGAAYSPLFAVERVRVVGTSTLDAAEVEAALAGQLGTPLPRVDSSKVKAALVQFPLVETYTLEARPPHELVVRIVERTPVGAISSSAGYTLVDAAGVALATTAEPPAGYPLIEVTGGVNSPAFAAVGMVYRSLPEDIRVQVTSMSATTANDVTLTLGGTGTKVVWGNADESAYKARVLATAMAVRPPGDVFTYDVSAPDAVVIR